MNLWSAAYSPLLRHFAANDCPICSTTPTMCATAIRLVYACRLVAIDLMRPIPRVKVLS